MHTAAASIRTQHSMRRMNIPIPGLGDAPVAGGKARGRAMTPKANRPKAAAASNRFVGRA